MGRFFSFKSLALILLVLVPIVTCSPRVPPKKVTAEVITVSMHDDYYTLSVNGHPVTKWALHRVVMNINSLIPEGTMTATFLMRSDKPNSYQNVVLSFPSLEAARKVLRNNSMIDVDGNSNVVVQNNNSNSGCFISTILR